MPDRRKSPWVRCNGRWYLRVERRVPNCWCMADKNHWCGMFDMLTKDEAFWELLWAAWFAVFGWRVRLRRE